MIVMEREPTIKERIELFI
jgi:hypothetical protein